MGIVYATQMMLSLKKQVFITYHLKKAFEKQFSQLFRYFEFFQKNT